MDAIINKKTIFIIPLLMVLIFASSCLDLSEKQTQTTNLDLEKFFPTGAAVFSPFQLANVNNAIPSFKYAVEAEYEIARQYDTFNENIESVFDGSDAEPALLITPLNFLHGPADATCFGPKLYYEGHPDGADGSPEANFATGAIDDYPSLPTGDLGLWLEIDETSGHACAAAEINSQVDIVGQHFQEALYGILMTAYAAVQAELITDALESFEETDVKEYIPESELFAVEEALVSYDGTEFVYDMTLTFEDADGLEYSTNIINYFTPGASSNEYEGILYYYNQAYFAGGHCPSSDVVMAGSMYYKKSSASELYVNAREGTYCGHDAVPAVAIDTDVHPTITMLDPNDGYDASSNPDGWGNNFRIFAASYDPDSTEGQYIYAWQAGFHDFNSRILISNVIEYAATTAGLAYYGFGDNVTSSDGSISGFKCNYTGPSADGELLEYVQKQSFEYDAVEELFLPTESYITYAPTNNCLNDDDTFWYDRDLDETQNETSDELLVGEAGSGSTLEFDLADITEVSSLSLIAF
ncbi:MAG: hypothetical protein ABIA04_02110 [Pseudomonadota bacterium]